MFRFEDPNYLYLLAIVPLLAIVRYALLNRQRKRLQKNCDPELFKMLAPDASHWRPAIKFWIMELAIVLLVVMIARPQMGAKIVNEKRVGIETVIAVDISNSMYAEDVAPSRLERSKMLVENLVDKFVDDKIGLIVFAGDAFVQLPITSDYVSAKLFLDNIKPSMITTQGTDIARAIELATNSFTKQEGIGRAIIVITDGENHEGGAVEAAEKATEEGMNVFVLGVGSTDGAPIPMPGTDDYMKDNTGNTVMSALNEKMCSEIASAGKGAFIHVTNNSRAQELLDKELTKLAQKEIETSVYSEYDEQFQAFCLIIILLLILDICLLERKNPLFKGVSLFIRKKATTMVLLLSMMTLNATAQNDRHYIREGNKAFNIGDYAKAEELYHKAIAKNNKNPQAHYNLGKVQSEQDKDSSAIVSYERAADLEVNKFRKALTYHNIGVICQDHKMYAEAIEAYKNALRNNPNDEETRYNLEVCRRQKDKQDQNNQQQQQQQKQQQQQDKKEQQQEQQQEQQKNQKQQDQQQQPQMSKEAAEQLLNAAKQQERNTNEKMEKAQKQPSTKRLQKNW